MNQILNSPETIHPFLFENFVPIHRVGELIVLEIVPVKINPRMVD